MNLTQLTETLHNLYRNRSSNSGLSTSPFIYFLGSRYQIDDISEEYITLVNSRILQKALTVNTPCFYT